MTESVRVYARVVDEISAQKWTVSLEGLGVGGGGPSKKLALEGYAYLLSKRILLRMPCSRHGDVSGITSDSDRETGSSEGQGEVIDVC
mmetsp:Transcript_1525/g.2870  ORF Transcript_1525/g.2870 Transcript_1525/m.2870 type:complete len:88 (-) Transcript_1525:103-366(-)